MGKKIPIAGYPARGLPPEIFAMQLNMLNVRREWPKNGLKIVSLLRNFHSQAAS